jgi:hypothetical protein
MKDGTKQNSTAIIQMSSWEKHLFLQDLKVFVAVSKKIEARIKKQSRKKRNKWTGTAAAAIVANRLLDKGIDPKKTVNFIEMVQKMVDSKLRSVSYLRSGFIPAFKEFKVPMRGDVSKKFKGRSMGVKAVPKPGDRIEAFTRNAREGTAAIAPNAFRDSLPEVRRQFHKWMMEKINRDAAKVGFKK